LELYQQYEVKKRQMRIRNTDIKPLENNWKELWHGTSPDAIENIIMNGFNRSYCGKNGEGSSFPQRCM
jgi:poly [ADP-ribose] polymerase 10/14/15